MVLGATGLVGRTLVNMLLQDRRYSEVTCLVRKPLSKQAFRRVDFEYVHVAAQLTRAQRANSFVWVSSVGADAKSSNFYLRVKGELENAIMRMPQLPHASAVRPSLLLGNRDESRTLEDIAQKTAPIWQSLMKGPLKKYRPVHAVDVARNMMSLQRW